MKRNERQSGFVACFICCCIRKHGVSVYSLLVQREYSVIGLFHYTGLTPRAWKKCLGFIYLFFRIHFLQLLHYYWEEVLKNRDLLIIKSFMTIFSLNSDVSSTWARNEGKRPGWGSTGLIK